MTSRFMSTYGELSEVRHKAVQDAKNMQKSIVRSLSAQNKPLPPYELRELIGKGSFGRVYKALQTETNAWVAVKIISIEEGDSMDPTHSDTFSDIIKEVNTLKMLNNSGARNINMVVDSLLVDQSIWMVTEYCAGGSVATLMRPLGGLPDKWIIPILRETAEAIYWVHKEGIIHRDIKCANVLVADSGDVQLCDFGVAGIMNTRFDKRSTVTGTLQWMAPELFESAAYGTEVDIWAFGSMVYEAASGLPPNATTLQNVANIGRYLKNNVPRLEGNYSEGLKDMVAFCLVNDPAKRPRIEDIMKHPYIYNSEEAFPTNSLAKLVKEYREWEAGGGSRRSLFAAGGAQPIMDDAPPMPQVDDWNFNTMVPADFKSKAEEDRNDNVNSAGGFDGYGSNSDFTGALGKRPRKRPTNLKAPTAPLEKVFDPNTLTNYQENARRWYGRGESPPMTSDMVMREEEKNARESLIDLDMSFEGTGMDAQGDTIRASLQPGAIPNNRRTQEWTFPVMREGIDEEPAPTFKESNKNGGGNGIYMREQHNLSQSSLNDGMSQYDPDPANRASVASLIDLDAGFGEDYSRPSTAQSDSGFVSDAEERFGLEKHTSRRYEVPMTTREPSLYVPTKAPREPSLYVPDKAPREPSLYVSEAKTTAALNVVAYDDMHPSDADDDDDGTIEIPDLGDDFSYREPSIYVTSEARTDREPSLYAQIDLGDAVHERPESSYGYSGHSRTGSVDSSRESGIYIPDFEDARREPSMIIPNEARTDRQPSLLIPADMEQGTSTSASPTDGYEDSYTPASPTPPSFGPREESLPYNQQQGQWNESVPYAPAVPFGESVAPRAPDSSVMEGMGGSQALKSEMRRLIGELRDHLGHTGVMLSALPVRRAEIRRSREDPMMQSQA